MNRKLIAALAFALAAAVPALPQTPIVSGLQLPTKIAFTRHRNLVVAEAGTPTNNTGRISIIDRATNARRTLLDGLPSGISRAEEPGSPSGPSGLAVQDRMVYVTIGAGDGVLPGPVPGSEMRNPTVASPILASLLSLQSSVPLDVAAGGFSLTPADHATLKNGTAVTLHNSAGDELVVRLVADFPDFTEEPRPDFQANVRAGNPFGVAILGQSLYVVDASQNVVRRVDANTGATSTLTTFGRIQNPTPVGPPSIDPVPDSIAVRGGQLYVTTLTGFPFPDGAARVLRVDPTNGGVVTAASGFTSAIDVAPLDAPDDAMVVLEFSANMLQQAAGRMKLVNDGVTVQTIAVGLPTPTSMVVDTTTGEAFVTHIFPGFVTKWSLAALPKAPPTAIVPVVAAVAGAFNSQFSTSVQISNPYPFATSGQLVVHPGGAPASLSDPSRTYTLAPFETKSIDDLIASGTGSVDVLAAVGAPAVVTTVRAGSNQLQIPMVSPSDAIGTGMRGTLITPADPSRQRFNIGIRSLGEGANVTMRVYDSSGALAATRTRVFGPNFFQQFAFADLLGTPAGANQSITFEVTGGSAIVYGSAVDNASGAMSFQLAEGVEP